MAIVILTIYYIILISFALDITGNGYGLISLYFALKWRFLKWKYNEKEHE